MAYNPSTITARIAEVQLDPLQFSVRMTATREFMGDYPGASIRRTSFIDEAIDAEVHHLTIELAAHKGKPIIISFPKDWWEALKLRLADYRLVQFYLRRHPVQMQSHTIYPWAILPDLKMPPHSRVLRWAEHVGPDVHRWHTEDN